MTPRQRVTQLLKAGSTGPESAEIEETDSGGVEKSLAVMFVLNIPHYLFQQIFNRDQAGCSAILINDNRQMNAFTFKLLQQLLQIF